MILSEATTTVEGRTTDVLLLLAVLVATAIGARALARVWVSTAAFLVLAGVLTGSSVLGWFDLGLTTGTVHVIAALALATVLFSDAATADLRVLRTVATQPVRLLTIGLVLTIVLGTLLAMAMFSPMTAALCLVVGTMLAPTDAALGAPVVLDPTVPSDVRQVLSVESGLNDGLAVPVLILALGWAGLEEGGNGFVQQLLVTLGLGAVVGAGLAVVVALAWSWVTARWGQEHAWSSLVPLLTAVGCYVLCEHLGASGFIGAFVGGLAFGVARRGRSTDLLVDESVSNALQGATWFVFGAMAVGPLITAGLFDWRWLVYAVLSLTVIRMVPVWLALLRSGQRPATVAFIGWFGPRGLASVVFLVIVLDLAPPHDDEVTIAGVTTTTVLLSILLHGVTAKPLARRYGAWAAAAAPR